MRTELHVPSDIRFLRVVEEWLLGSLEAELGDKVDWPQQANRLRLVLSEAYSNVVRHAHQQQPNLPVLIRLELKSQEVKLEIWDYGQGYDLSTYLPPKPEEMQEHGYGWLILNRLMDKVEYRLQISGRNCLSLAADLSTKPDFERVQRDGAQSSDQTNTQKLDPTQAQASKFEVNPQDQGQDSSKDIH